MLNFAGCHECHKKSFVDESEKNAEEDEEGKEESISFKRKCIHASLT